MHLHPLGSTGTGPCPLVRNAGRVLFVLETILRTYRPNNNDYILYSVVACSNEHTEREQNRYVGAAMLHNVNGNKKHKDQVPTIDFALSSSACNVVPFLRLETREADELSTGHDWTCRPNNPSFLRSRELNPGSMTLIATRQHRSSLDRSADSR